MDYESLPDKFILVAYTTSAVWQSKPQRKDRLTPEQAEGLAQILRSAVSETSGYLDFQAASEGTGTRHVILSFGTIEAIVIEGVK